MFCSCKIRTCFVLLIYFTYLVSAGAVDSKPVSSETGLTSEKIDVNNPTDAAKVLVSVIPDSAALVKHYSALIEIVRTAQGEMDLSILYDACTGCHRWHSFVIIDKQKNLAMLEWMSQKMWEMPRSSTKKQLLEQYITDIGKLIDSNQIEKLVGLKIAASSMHMDMGSDIIGSDIQTNALLNLFKQYINSDRKEVKRYIINSFRFVPESFLSETVTMDSFCDLIKQHDPAFAYCENREDYFRPHYVTLPKNVSRTTYEEIIRLSIPELRTKVNVREGSKYACEFSIGRIFDTYDTNPEETKKTIRELIKNDIMTREIQLSLASPPFYGSSVNKSHPVEPSVEMIDTILDCFEPIMEKQFRTFDGDSFISHLGYCAEVFNKRNVNGKFPEGERLQKRCVKMIVDSIALWERVNIDLSLHKDNPSKYAIETYYASFSNETKKYFKNLLMQKASETNTYSDFPSGTQDKIRNLYREYLSLK